MSEFLVKEREIPYQWSEVVCSCIEPSYHHSQVLQDNPTVKDVCTKCNKLPKWQLLTCRKCNQQYIWWFKHRAVAHGGWARHQQFCWNCIIKEDPATEEDTPPLYTHPPREIPSLNEALDMDSLNFDLEF